MQLYEVTAEEYGQAGFFAHVYNTPEFSELNKGKTNGVHYLLIKDNKTRFSIVLGEKDGCLYSPFSAPYGGFNMKTPQRIAYMDEAVALLKDWGKGLGMKIKITLQPSVYDHTQLSKWSNVMFRNGRLTNIDLNYHFDLSRFPHYEDFIDRSARKNLHKAMNEDFIITHLDSSNNSDVARAYSVISINRKEHGYPLRMSLHNVTDTVKIIDADFFVVSHNGIDVAAAQVFKVTDGVAQVIYWGDIKEYSNLRTMNFLSYKVFEYYHNKGFRILDIGPSTEDGIPNNGLCDFKEGIGCSVTQKMFFEL